jgi:ABC-type amino acid transport substrate-binding protein
MEVPMLPSTRSGAGPLAAALIALAVAFAASPARADEPDTRSFLLCHVSGVSDASEAQPYVEKFGRYLARRLGWKPGSLEMRFEAGRKKGLKALDASPPGFATVSVGMYLARREALKMKPVVLARINERTTDRFRVLVKKGSYGSLDELKGKTITGDLVDDVAFVSRIVFQGRYQADKDFKLKYAKRPLRAIRKVARGRVDAVLVNAVQYESLKELPLFDKLAPVFESQDIPNLGLVHLQGRVPDFEALKLTEALVGMCDDEEGGKICETFGIEGFDKTNEEAFSSLIEAYTKGATRK